MTTILVIFEGIISAFIVLLACVAGTANGAHNMVFFYNKDVQERVVENGLITKEKLEGNRKKFTYFGILPYFVLAIMAVYLINKARGFLQPFIQFSAIFLIEGFFDRLFIDWYWVNHTKFWQIPGTEDLRPYINKKNWLSKWTTTLIGYPVIAAIISLALFWVIK